ncbi:hypothetical protein D9758_016675 [Tetrapyrgos nigripes]|uniref:Ankyrin n=1 Tax=Tetrapyrgos nigripes TaxID=182062 RepID=A0A8H5FHL0_9AGAR|nr:hypothetical protein D9758_016675 [Tetrapyrgos nigripes]
MSKILSMITDTLTIINIISLLKPTVSLSKIKKWINAPDPSLNYNAAYEKMSEGTGVWLLEYCNALLDKGADVNAQGGKYGNALQAGSFQGDKNLVRILLERGADVNAQGGE